MYDLCDREITLLNESFDGFSRFGDIKKEDGYYYLTTNLVCDQSYVRLDHPDITIIHGYEVPIKLDFVTEKFRDLKFIIRLVDLILCPLVIGDEEALEILKVSFPYLLETSDRKDLVIKILLSAFFHGNMDKSFEFIIREFRSGKLKRQLENVHTYGIIDHKVFLPERKRILDVLKENGYDLKQQQ